MVEVESVAAHPSRRGFFVRALKEVSFDRYAEVAATLGPNSSPETAVCCGIGFGVGTPEQVIYLLAASYADASLTLYRFVRNRT